MLFIAAWTARGRIRPRAAVLVAVALAGAASLGVAWPIATRGGAFPALLTAGAIGLCGLLDWLVGAALSVGRAVRWLDARLGARPWGTVALLVGGASARLSWVYWPLWIESWQPIGVGLGVGSVLWATGTRRPALALAGAGFAACFTVPGIVPGAWVLLVAAATSARVPRFFTAAAAALGAYLVTPLLLNTEVVFTVLLAWAATMFLGALVNPVAMEADGPR